MNQSLPREVVDYWDLRIKGDLQARMASHDRQWEKNHEMVRNTGKGFRNGNLAAEFIRTLHIRLLAQDPQINVRPDDPNYSVQAQSAEIVSGAVSRIAKLRSAIKEVSTAATWASLGWLEYGHPLDPWCNDIMRIANSPNAPAGAGSGEGQDEYEEVSPTELEMRGVQVDKVQPFDPFNTPPSMSPGEQEPLPIFNPMFGYPWVSAVDPRYVVTNLNAKDKEGIDYISRIRFLTKKELARVRGYQYASRPGVGAEYRDLFEKVEGQSLALYPEMMMIMETWIIRDRNNPEYNNFYLCHVFGEPDSVIQSGPNPYGGMVPLSPVKLSRLKKLYDTTLVEELTKYADLFHIGVNAMHRQFKRSLNPKWTAAQSAGLDAEAEKKLKNDEYTGVIKVGDPRSVQELVEQKFDVNVLQSMNWIKSLAQSATGASDLDRGQAIKDITARQTQALLEATGINVEGMKDSIEEVIVEAVLKLMHLVGLYNHSGRAREYYYGKRVANFDQGQHDFTTSLTYDVQVVDNKQLVSNEERMLWVQLLRLLFADTGGQLLPYYDREEIAKAVLRKFGEGPELLASRGANLPPTGLPAVPPGMEGQPGLPGNVNGNAGSVLPFPGMEAVTGQHPERAAGSRGVSMQNLMSGAIRTGSGSGERDQDR